MTKRARRTVTLSTAVAMLLAATLYAATTTTLTETPAPITYTQYAATFGDTVYDYCMTTYTGTINSCYKDFKTLNGGITSIKAGQGYRWPAGR